MKIVGVLGAVLAVAAAGPVLAQSAGLSPEQMVAVRKSLMDLQGGVAGAMKGAVDAKADVKPLKMGAQALVSSSKVIVALFPPGTEKVGDTRAKSEVWSDRATFEKDAVALQQAADKLVALADANDKAGFGAQFAEVGKACGACHREFRVKE